MANSQKEISLAQKLTTICEDDIYLCTMLKLIFELFVFYLLYKLIFEFIIPVYYTTKQMSKKMNQMQNEMNRQQQSQQAQQTANSEQKPKDIEKEYIDFEEVK
jgi:hypothetical protein